MQIIAGDIGGTKSWLAWLAVSQAGERRLRFERRYPSADFASADSLLRQFIADAGVTEPPELLLLALPGALAGQRVKLTNLDWTLEASAMRATLGIDRVCFVNDFQAAAAGVATLAETDWVALNAVAAKPGGVRVVTGAGTGLGLAYMVAGVNGDYQSFATEAGHSDFAPANAMQGRLLESLRKKQAHVSWERVVSGSAMHDLYCFCRVELGQCLPDAFAQQSVDGVRLSALAASGDPAAVLALDLFVEMYAAWVGNVALLYQPVGGLYIAGGVAAHMTERMTAPRFMAVAASKGRMCGVVERTPIFLITQTRLGLAGAIQLAFGITSA